MTGNDITPQPFQIRVKDLSLALGLLTRIPLPPQAFPAPDGRPGAHAAWAYSLIGIVVGGLVAVVAWAALALGLPQEVAALLAIGTGVLTTGAMHEDGLADCADGFWGGWTRERRLEIMKDSQIGTYGMLALLLTFGLRWTALSVILTTPHWGAILIGAAAFSRGAMVAMMYILPNAREKGLSHQTGRPPRTAMFLAVVVGTALLIGCLPFTVLPVLMAGGAALLIIGLIAKAKIGGQTGDVLGATQQIVEIAVLLACLPLLT